jgi:dihydrofolate reductase
MSKLIFSSATSADGFIQDRDGKIDFTAPSEELHRFHNERVRQLGGQLLGRRLYETMVFWEGLEEREPDAHEVMLEFAPIWRALPKVVFTRTLDHVEGNTRIATGSQEEELAKLRSEVDGDIAVGGAGLAAEYARLGLIDEYQLFVCPVVLGGGTPFFPELQQRIQLELLETRAFDEVVYLRYAARS